MRFRLALVLASLLLLPAQRLAAITLLADYSKDAEGQGFSDPDNGAARRAALEYALQLWGDALEGPSDVTIVVESRFVSFPKGVLAASNPAAVEGDFPNSIPGLVYATAAAKAISGQDGNGDAPEIILQFNRNETDFYYGTDGRPPTNKIDFVTVALHELAHGLGFAYYLNPDTGQWRFGAPDAYSLHLALEDEESGDSRSLPEMTPQERLEALDSGGLAYDGPSLRSYFGEPAPVYAPEPFDRGSSISHWDSAAFENSGLPPELMEPKLGTGIILHDVGLAREVFADMGYTLAPSASPQISFPTGFSNQASGVRAATAQESAIVDLPVVLSAPAANPVQVDLEHLSGTAEEGVDFRILNRRLTIPKGQRRGLFRVQLLEDESLESLENARFQLANPQGGTIRSENALDTFSVRIEDRSPNPQNQSWVFF